MAVQEKAPELLKESEARTLLNVGKTTFWNLIWSGQLGSVRIGRSVYVPRNAIDEFIRALPSASKHVGNAA